jgi:hypothetical protein
MPLARLLVAVTLLVSGACAQQPDPWALLKPFAGRWAGTYEGQAGKGTGNREYAWQLDGKFLSVSNTSKYENELHRDYGIFSYDRHEKTFVLRQFHVEGFVNEYEVYSTARLKRVRDK